MSTAVAPNIPSYRWWVLGYTFTAVSLTAGLVYGWPSARQQLVTYEGSELSESALGAVYTAGAWSTQGCRILTGLARDRYGCRVVTCVCLLCVMAGCIGLAWSSANSAVALGISVFIMGLGSGVQLCLGPVASSLFPQSAGTILASLSGAFQISGLVFLAVLKMANHQRQWAFSILTLVLSIWFLGAILLLPNATSFVIAKTHTVGDEEREDEKGEATAQPNVQPTASDPLPIENGTDDAENASPTPVIQPTDNDATTDHNICRKETEDSSAASRQQKLASENTTNPDDTGHLSNSVVDNSDDKQEEENQVSLWGQMKTKEYVLLLTWFSCLITPLQFYIGSLGFQLENLGDESGFYANLFSILYASAAVLSPFAGSLADACGLGVGEAVATFISSLSFFFLAVGNHITLSAQTVGLACNGVGRMVVYAMFFCHIGKRFGYKNYGTLAGLGLLISAVVSLLQYPMISAAADGHASTVNWVCGGILVGTLPYCGWLAVKEYREGGIRIFSSSSIK